MMGNLNIFEKFREYQSRKVDNPNYEPLRQKVMSRDEIMKIVDREEIRKAKKREYNKKYNENRTEEQKTRDRELRRKYYYEHKDDHKIPEKVQKSIRQKIKDPNEPTELQINVYNYMLEKYKETWKIPRAQQIARDFGKTDASIYSVLALLVKKWKLYKWVRGQLYFTSDYELKEPEMVDVEENKYDKLLDESSLLYKENLELKTRIGELEEQVKKLEEQVNNSVWHIEWVMESNNKLEIKNMTLSNNVEELKWVIKTLIKYFG